MTKQSFPRFWGWLLRAEDGRRAGYTRLLNWWLVLHIIIGGAIAFILKDGKIEGIATSLIIPIAGILVALSFAWAGNASALLQTKEIGKLAGYKRGGIEEYIFTFQLAILLLLVTLIFWGLGGLGIWDILLPKWGKVIMQWFLFTLVSISVRECWHIVLGANILLQMRIKIRQNEESKNEKDSS